MSSGKAALTSASAAEGTDSGSKALIGAIGKDIQGSGSVTRTFDDSGGK